MYETVVTYCSDVQHNFVVMFTSAPQISPLSLYSVNLLPHACYNFVVSRQPTTGCEDAKLAMEHQQSQENSRPRSPPSSLITIREKHLRVNEKRRCRDG